MGSAGNLITNMGLKNDLTLPTLFGGMMENLILIILLLVAALWSLK